MRDWLQSVGVTHVAIDSTWDYWKSTLTRGRQHVQDCPTPELQLSARRAARRRHQVVICPDRPLGGDGAGDLEQTGGKGRAIRSALTGFARDRLSARLPARGTVLQGRVVLVEGIMSHIDFLEGILAELQPQIEATSPLRRRTKAAGHHS